jgi:hypothetical protein
VSPWDYERLVLEEFPDVCKVKVFPNTDVTSSQPAPGRVLVVVVPRLAGADANLTRSVRLSGSRLAEIQSFLRGRASRSAWITAMNPVYEYIELRCAVKLTGGRPPGISLKELNGVTVEFLSPWSREGYGPRFGWRIRSDDVVGRLRKAPFVEFVTDFSMLQVTRKLTGRYRLEDTARTSPGPVVKRSTGDLEAHYPWSLALPVPEHDIRISESEVSPEMAGIGDLKIGSNFIVGADDDG